MDSGRQARGSPAIRSSNKGTAAWIAPFVTFVALMAIEKALPVASGWPYAVRALATTLVLVFVSRRVISWVPSAPVASTAVGLAVFAIWIGPDLLWPAYRQHWLFSNSLLGGPNSTLPDALKGDVGFLSIRVFGSVVLVPILEELFWRGWLMRWLINPKFAPVPLGTYTPYAFWVTALLFASEHGSYWDVGLLAGIIYNWWLIRT